MAKLYDDLSVPFILSYSGITKPIKELLEEGIEIFL